MRDVVTFMNVAAYMYIGIYAPEAAISVQGNVRLPRSCSVCLFCACGEPYQSVHVHLHTGFEETHSSSTLPSEIHGILTKFDDRLVEVLRDCRVPCVSSAKQ